MLVDDWMFGFDLVGNLVDQAKTYRTLLINWKIGVVWFNEKDNQADKQQHWDHNNKHEHARYENIT